MLKRLIIAAAILAGLLAPAYSAGLYPLSRAQVFDSNSKIMPGARLFLYDGGTSTPRIGYRDLALTTPHPNPIVADSAGRLPLIYLDDGYYRQRLTSKTGTLIFDDDGIPVLTTSAGGAGTTVDPDAIIKTRDIKFRFDDQPVSGYVRLNGRTIGSASSGATERANADTQSLYEELWSFSTISVTGGKGASAAADYAANKPLALPNAAGRGLIGADDLGAGAQSVITSATCGSADLIGVICGSQNATIGATSLPVSSPWLATATVTVTGVTNTAGAHNHGGATGAGASNNHNHDYQAPGTTNLGVLVGNDAPAWSGVTTTQTGIENQNMGHTHSIATDPGHAHTVSASGTPTVTMQSNGGGGQAFSKLQPIMTMTIYIRL